MSKILVFLLLGAILNVAVAWGCAAWRMPPILASNTSGARYGNALIDAGIWWMSSRRRPGIAIATSQFRAVWPGPITHPSANDPEGAIPSWSRIRRPGSQGEQFVSGVQTDWATGWPWLSMRGGFDTNLTLPPDQRHTTVEGVPIEMPVDVGLGGRVLPLHVLWPGAIANTLVYALAAWLLPWIIAGGPIVARREFRRRRGRCIKCGYDLRGDFDAGCPECGWNRVPVKTRPQRHAMRRFRRLAVFLALGALLTIVAAWGCARLYAPLAKGGWPGTEPYPWARGRWARVRVDEWPNQPDESTRGRLAGMTWFSAYASNEGNPCAVGELRFGLPLNSMSMEFWGSGRAGGHYRDVFPGKPTVYPALADPGFIVPTRPMWHPFIADTLFWALALWCLITARRKSREHRRRARGRCIKCNYDLRGDFDTGCPECGWNRPEEAKA